VVLSEAATPVMEPAAEPKALVVESAELQSAPWEASASAALVWKAVAMLAVLRA